MRISASPEVVERVRGATGRLYVWSTTSRGCQGMTRLETGAEPPGGRAFRQVPFAPFDLYLAAGGAWPEELGLETAGRGVAARWDGAAWRI